MHYDGQAGRTGVCTIGDSPWKCGDGDAQDIGYAPIARGAGSYLPDMSNHGAHAPEVGAQGTSELYGAGSTRPVTFHQVSLGEEHVHLVKSIVGRHTELQKSQCLLCSMRGARGGAVRPDIGFQSCTCAPIQATDVAKTLVSRMSNAQRVGVSFDDLAQWVRDVAKAGFKLPVPRKARSLGARVVDPERRAEDRALNRPKKPALSDQVQAEAKTRKSDPIQIQLDRAGGHLTPTIEKASFYHMAGRYDVTPAGGGKHHVDFHPREGGPSSRLNGPFGSPKAARHALMVHARRVTEGGSSSKTGESPTAPTRKIRAVGSGPPVEKSTGAEDHLSKSYMDEWVAQFRGTPLFKEAHKLCEQELELQEAQLKDRVARLKHDKERAAAVAKIRPQQADRSWEEESVRRERVQIAKQRLVLKLADLRLGGVEKGDSVSKAIDNTKHSHVVTGKLAPHGAGYSGRKAAHAAVDRLDSKYGSSAHTVARNPNYKPKTLKWDKTSAYGPGGHTAEAGHGAYVHSPEPHGQHTVTYYPHGQGKDGALHGGTHSSPAAAHAAAEMHHQKMIGG